MALSEWTSLEVVKLVVDVLTPVAVVGLGIAVARVTSRLEHNQWASRTVVETRLEIFREVAPKLNKLLCYYTFVGTWKSLDPDGVIDLKRELDETMFTNRVLFSPELFESYLAFMDTLFETFATPDRDALLRAHIETGLGNRRSLPGWTDQLEARFASSDIPSDEAVNRAYSDLNERFRTDLYVIEAS